MPANGLLVIAPVRAGREEALRQTLNRLGNDIRGTRASISSPAPRIEFTRSRTLHFARLTLLDDPARNPGAKRLLFTTDYDGALEDHLREIIELTREPEAIWGCCEGDNGPDYFPEFIRRHTITPEAYYIAFRNEALSHLRDIIALRSDLDSWLSDPDAGRVLWALPDVLRIGRAVRSVVRTLWWPLDVSCRGLLSGIELAGLMLRLGVRDVLGAALKINATLDRVWWIKPLNMLFRNRPSPPPHRHSQARGNDANYPRQADPAPPPEDAILQNQLTLVTDVRPEYLPRLRAVLALIDLYGRRLSTPGSLVGISTIHTVRWVIIDGGQRLLMVSNYDGTWENYIDEFAEMILSGLDALWTSDPLFPRAGAQDVAALKQFLRAQQAPANVFYSAYPTASVLNLKLNLEFARWFGWFFRFVTEGRAPAPAP